MTGRLAARWALPLRVARREAWRAKGRSLLVLVLIALPVVAVTASAVVVATTQVSGAEGIDRRLGAAQARVDVSPDTGRVLQGADPDQGALMTEGPAPQQPLDAAALSRRLGGAPTAELRQSQARFVSDDGAAPVETTELDLADPLTRGLFDLTAGRWPSGSGEVVVNQALLDRLGLAVGGRLEPATEGGPTPRVVGVAESTAVRTMPVAAGPLGSLGADTRGVRSWLVGGDPVTWSEVRALNEAGAVVVSRTVVLDPPPADQLPPELGTTGSADPTLVAVLALVVAMVLLEVVLLAGPAFAVGAKRQARSLALMSSSGATPAQVRRSLLATAVVLGSVAAVGGVLLGLGVAAAAMPLVQRLSGSWLGPFDVPWLPVLAVGAFGLVSALLAALAPAVMVARQDVVAVLAGRRGEARPSRVSPAIGGVLLALGVGGAAYGALTRGSELSIAVAAVLCVLGTVLLVPTVLSLLGRTAHRLPLVVRYAVRDAARQRSRTAPAGAAVAATVAGVVTLGIGASSDAAESRSTYQPTLTSGSGVVTPGWSETGAPLPATWDAAETVVERALPDARTTAVVGLGDPDGDSYTEVLRPGSTQPVLSSYGSALGGSELVGDAAPPAVPGLSATTRERIRTALAAGRAVVFADEVGDSDTVRVRVDRVEDDGSTTPVARETLPATYVAVGGATAPAQLLLPPELARGLGPTRTVGLVVDGTAISAAQEEAVAEGVAALGMQGSFYVERGYQADDEDVIVLLVLFALGAVLVLGGTLTATFLALSDARPDLATLAAVGASPRARRGIAASYAFVVGFVGSVLGAVVGAVPGLAVAVPLTSQGADGVWTVEGSGSVSGAPPVTGPFLDVPWLLVLGLVVVLPLLTAALVGLLTRARLPLVARAA